MAIIIKRNHVIRQTDIVQLSDSGCTAHSHYKFQDRGLLMIWLMYGCSGRDTRSHYTGIRVGKRTNNGDLETWSGVEQHTFSLGQVPFPVVLAIMGHAQYITPTASKQNEQLGVACTWHGIISICSEFLTRTDSPLRICSFVNQGVL